MTHRLSAAPSAANDDPAHGQPMTLSKTGKPKQHRVFRTWAENTADVAAYTKTHGTFPQPKDTDANIHRLGMWLTNARVRYRRNNLTDEQIRMLDEHVPGWLTQTWAERVGELIAFHIEHGRLPRKAGNNAREDRMGNFLAGIRSQQNLGTLPANKKEHLDAHLPGWNLSPHLIRWHERADEFKEWTDNSGRLPSNSAPAGSDELRAADWLDSQRKFLRRGTLTDEKTAWLDENTPIWREDSWTKWLRRAEQLLDFITAEGRFPSQAGSPSEVKLSLFYRDLVSHSRKGKLGDRRTHWLDENFPGWLDGGLMFWESNLDALTRLGRNPATKDADPDVRRLAAWVHHRRLDLRNGKLTPKQVADLDCRAPWWRGSLAA